MTTGGAVSRGPTDYARNWIQWGTGLLSLLVPASMLVLAGVGKNFVGTVHGTLLLAGAITNFMAVTAIASAKELTQESGTPVTRFLLTIELLFFGIAMGYSLYKAGLPADANMWISFFVVCITLFTPWWPDVTRIGFLSWAIALVTSLYLSTAFFSILKESLCWLALNDKTLNWMEPRYGAYLHLIIVPAAYVFFDSILKSKIQASQQSLKLDWVLLGCGLVCLFAGFSVETEFFELGSSTALLLFANAAYFIAVPHDLRAPRFPDWQWVGRLLRRDTGGADKSGASA